MNTKLVSSIDAVARSRLQTISADATLVDASKLLSNTQIGLVVVCNADGAMVGVVTKTASSGRSVAAWEAPVQPPPPT